MDKELVEGQVVSIRKSNNTLGKATILRPSKLLGIFKGYLVLEYDEKRQEEVIKWYTQGSIFTIERVL